MAPKMCIFPKGSLCAQMTDKQAQLFSFTCILHEFAVIHFGLQHYLPCYRVDICCPMAVGVRHDGGGFGCPKMFFRAALRDGATETTLVASVLGEGI